MQRFKTTLILFILLFISGCGMQQALLSNHDQINRIDQIINEDQSLTDTQRNKLREINLIYSTQYLKAVKNNLSTKKFISAIWNNEINLVIEEETKPNQSYAVKYQKQKSHQ